MDRTFGSILTIVLSCVEPGVEVSLKRIRYYQNFGGSGNSVGMATVTGWTVRGSNPGGGEIFRTCPDRPWSPPSLLYNGYRVFAGG
jgi:hypothetical protein